MKIGIYGNDNNTGLLLASALRVLGHAPRLVVTRRDGLHRPESYDEKYAGGYPWWIHDASACDDLDYACLTSRLYEPLNFLHESEFLILNHVGPSLAPLWSMPYACFLTGSDLNFYGNYDTLHVLFAANGADFKRSPAGRLSQRQWETLIGRQRNAIAAAQFVVHPPRGLVPNGDILLDQLGVPDERREFLIPAFAPLDLPAPPGDRLRILCGARHVWKQPLPAGFSAQDDKGLNVLIEGAARFKRANPGAPFELQLIDKGCDVPASKALADDLGLDGSIRWLPEMPVRQFLAATAAADVVVDHFGPAVPGHCAWTGMAAGKPVLANFHPAALQQHFGEPVPGCHAISPGEVARWLERLSDERSRTALATRVADFAARQLAFPPQLERMLARL